MKVIDLCNAALRLIGVVDPNDTPPANIINTTIEALNLLLQEWHNKNLLSFTEQQEFNTTYGITSYAIGYGYEWDGYTPLDIIHAVINDVPLTIINENEYMNLPDKNTLGKPYFLWYKKYELTNYSTLKNMGRVFLYPSPDGIYTVKLCSLLPFTEYTLEMATQTDIDLPDGYLTALKFNLAADIAPEFGKQPEPFILKRATETLNALKTHKLKLPMPIEYDPILTRR